MFMYRNVAQREAETLHNDFVPRRTWPMPLTRVYPVLGRARYSDLTWLDRNVNLTVPCRTVNRISSVAQPFGIARRIQYRQPNWIKSVLQPNSVPLTKLVSSGVAPYRQPNTDRQPIFVNAHTPRQEKYVSIYFRKTS